MMLRLFPALFLAGMLFCASACTPRISAFSKATLEREIEKGATDFPQSWFGYWQGELSIYREGKKVQEVPCALEMGPTAQPDRFTWAIIYGEDVEKGRRDYELVLRDKDKGLYVNDEKNSIFIESYHVDNKLVSRFEVMGNMLFSTYEKIGEAMVFEIWSGSTDPVSITGKGIEAGEDIPEVKTYPLPTFQRAILTRMLPAEKK